MGKVNAASVEVMDGWTCTDLRPFGGVAHALTPESGDFYISYNPDTSLGLIDRLAHALGADKGGEETALVIVKGGGKKEFLILQGDWRAAYQELVPKGLKACREFYERNKSHRTMWSDDHRRDMELMA